MPIQAEQEGNPDLIEFMGTECEVCHEMAPVIERLEKEEGIKLTRYEIWHNEDNKQLFMEMDQGKCGGIPLFVNKKTGKTICGAASYEDFKAWAKGE